MRTYICFRQGRTGPSGANTCKPVSARSGTELTVIQGLTDLKAWSPSSYTRSLSNTQAGRAELQGAQVRLQEAVGSCCHRLQGLVSFLDGAGPARDRVEEGQAVLTSTLSLLQHAIIRITDAFTLTGDLQLPDGMSYFDNDGKASYPLGLALHGMSQMHRTYRMQADMPIFARPLLCPDIPFQYSSFPCTVSTVANSKGSDTLAQMQSWLSLVDHAIAAFANSEEGLYLLNLPDYEFKTGSLQRGSGELCIDDCMPSVYFMEALWPCTEYVSI